MPHTTTPPAAESADTKKALASEQESRQVAEAAREAEWEHRSFARGLFDGRVDLGLIDPMPAPPAELEAEGKEFLDRLARFVEAHVDGDEIDRTGEVPQSVLDGLAEIGAFGIKIPKEYGGLGLSQTTYNRALGLVTSRCNSTAAFLSAHQSIGVPQPLVYFGTDEQKQRYLPRIARGELSAFALTEPDVGSDPANMSTRAEPTEDGSAYILNGEKLWCTNGPRSEMMVVMARTPAKEGRKRDPITAFIVETGWEGVEVIQHCHFMGLRGIANGVLRFTNVRVPKENVLWGEGRGLKLALITLNTGRLSLPAFCAAGAKLCLQASRRWAKERFQWGTTIGKHDAIAQKIGTMAANTFAMDSVVTMTSGMADAGGYDIRLEAAIAKMWHSETAWELANDALQIRGGRGYETVESLRERGEAPYPIERLVRDTRINLIFEGSSEIMRLFIAREAVDRHLEIAGTMIDPKAPIGARLGSAIRAGVHYAWWYPSRWIGWSLWPRYASYGKLARHLRFVHRASGRLARSIFHAMVRFGPGLEKRQAVLGRVVEIGAELFVMAVTCVNAQAMLRQNPGDRTPEALADLFCRQAKKRVGERFRALFGNADSETYALAQRVVEEEFTWLEEGIVPLEDR